MIKRWDSKSRPNFIGFYWTRPVPDVGFLKLSAIADTAAKESKTIRFQREVIKKWVDEEGLGGELIEEITFLEVRSDAGTSAVEECISKAAKICREKNATLLYVDFNKKALGGWRTHQFMIRAIEHEGIDKEAIQCPEIINMDDGPFNPKSHFITHVARYKSDAEKRRKDAIEGLFKELETVPASPQKNAVIAERLNAAGITTIRKKKWTPATSRNCYKERSSLKPSAIVRTRPPNRRDQG